MCVTTTEDLGKVNILQLFACQLEVYYMTSMDATAVCDYFLVTDIYKR